MPIRLTRNKLRKPDFCKVFCFLSLVTLTSMPDDSVVGQEISLGIPNEPVSPSAQAPSELSNSPKEADPRQAEADLDSLLDMADKDPTQLQSVQVQPSTSSSSTASHTSGDVAGTDFDVQSNSGASSNSTGELLSHAPSVVVRKTSALNQDARIRGLSGSQIAGVANGMNQAKSRLDIDSLFSQIDPNLIESVSVIAGPYSVMYGPGFAFFDARLIEPGRSEDWTFGSHSTFGYNNNGGQLSYRETMRLSNANGGAIVSLGQRVGNDYRAGKGFGDLLIPSSYDVHDIFTTISRDWGEHSRFDFTYSRQEMQNVELPGVVYDINDQESDQFNVRWTMKDDFKDDRWQNQFWWNQVTYNGDASRPSKRASVLDRLIGDVYPGYAGGTLFGHGLSDNWGARSQILLGDQDGFRGGVGADWRRIRQRYRENSFFPDGSELFPGDTFGLPESSSDDFGVFAHGDMQVTDRLTLGVGQRLDRIRYSVDGNDIVSAGPQITPGGGFIPGISERDRTLSSTYITSRYKITEATTFNFGTAYAMRNPNLTELYSDQPYTPTVRFGNSFVFGDSDLKSEKNLQFDLGMSSNFETRSVGARAFHSSIQDYIGLAATNYSTFPDNSVAIPGSLGRGKAYMQDPALSNLDITSDTAQLGYAYRNIDRVTLYGFELFGDQRITPWFEILGSANFTEGINHEPTVVDLPSRSITRLSEREGLPGIYPMQGTLTFRLLEPETRKWNLDWQCRFARHQNYLATTLGELGTPGFGVHNIHASYQWNKNLRFRSSLLNVFDRNYFEHNSLAIIGSDGNVTFVREPGISWFSSFDYVF